jgi:hypothetical protein
MPITNFSIFAREKRGFRQIHNDYQVESARFDSHFICATQAFVAPKMFAESFMRGHFPPAEIFLLTTLYAPANLARLMAWLTQAGIRCGIHELRSDN